MIETPSYLVPEAAIKATERAAGYIPPDYRAGFMLGRLKALKHLRAMAPEVSALSDKELVAFWTSYAHDVFLACAAACGSDAMATIAKGATDSALEGVSGADPA